MWGRSKKTQGKALTVARGDWARLVGDVDRLNTRIDRLIQVVEREQVLRQQLQSTLQDSLRRKDITSDKMDTAVTLRKELSSTRLRLRETEARFLLLRDAVRQLLERLGKLSDGARS